MRGGMHRSTGPSYDSSATCALAGLSRLWEGRGAVRASGPRSSSRGGLGYRIRRPFVDRLSALVDDHEATVGVRRGRPGGRH